MIIRLLLVLTFLSACSSGGQDVSKTIDVPAAQLAEIQSKPYTAARNNKQGPEVWRINFLR